MTVTNQYVAPIEAGEQPGGLLQTARPLPSGDWRGGISFTPVVASIGRWGCVTSYDPNDPDAAPEKTIDDQTDAVRFDPFLLYSGASCSGAPDEQELRLIARAGMVRGKSGEAAHELVTSLFGNPDLSTVAQDITPGTPGDLKSSLSVLLSATKDARGEVVLHADIAALPYLVNNGVEVRDGRYWLGLVPVVVDDYPFVTAREADGDANPSWTPLYMTRPVEAATGSAVDEFNMETRLNRGTVLVEEIAILRFDPAFAYTVIADLAVS